MAETEGTLTALDVLRRDGWHQGWYSTDGGTAVCLIRAASNADTLTWPWITAVSDVIRAEFPSRAFRAASPPGTVSLAKFNDHPDTTFADVEVVLEKAQVRLDEVTADV